MRARARGIRQHALMSMSRRTSWWTETLVLFGLFTGAFAALSHWLIESDDSWAESLLRGAAFAVLMVAFLSWRTWRGGRRSRDSRQRSR